ncbi:MAG TPA: sigma-70 family RNA polymerase sigma factor, partial [Polyangiaceae bacterium]
MGDAKDLPESKESIGKLLESYAPTIHRFALRMCRDPEDARDVVQETMLAASRGLDGFRGESSLSTWLFTIARSFCIKARRLRTGEPERVLSLESEDVEPMRSGAAAPDEAAGERELGRALEAAIGALDPMYREVLVLRDAEGLTAPEVATVLGIGVDAVKSRLHRARTAVREKLAPLLHADAPPSPGCPDVVPILSRYLEGEIAHTDCADMECHVAGCPRCRAQCDSLRRTLDLCRASATRAQQVPPEVQEQVRRALRE